MNWNRFSENPSTAHAPVVRLRNPIDQGRVPFGGTGRVEFHAHAAVRLGPDAGGDINPVSSSAHDPRIAIFARNLYPLILERADDGGSGTVENADRLRHVGSRRSLVVGAAGDQRTGENEH